MIIVWVKTRRNPYPIVFTALRESGVTAFFTRSSAANIPVNLALCERLDLEKDTFVHEVELGDVDGDSEIWYVRVRAGDGSFPNTAQMYDVTITTEGGGGPGGASPPLLPPPHAGASRMRP